jgi:hypothetical protein
VLLSEGRGILEWGVADLMASVGDGFFSSIVLLLCIAGSFFSWRLNIVRSNSTDTTSTAVFVTGLYDA